MKNHRLTICFIFLGVLLATITVFVFISKAQGANSLNPYDDRKLNIDQIVDLYHNNMNDAFNEYIKRMMTSKPDDPLGKAFHVDTGIPFTAAECLDPANANNYSTFCVSVNMLGGNSDDCLRDKSKLTPDMKQFCTLGKNAKALNGYLNFSAAVRKRTKSIFKTVQEESDYIATMVCLGGVDFRYFPVPAGIVCDDAKKAELQKNAQQVNQTTKALEYSYDINFANNEVSIAKETLDQALSAYDQLKVAWPIHLKYVDIYAALEKYRDNLVSVRRATDNYPKQFIDLTTTSCL